MTEMISLEEAAAEIKKSPRTIRRYIDKGILKAFTAGARGLLVRRCDVGDLVRPFVPKAKDDTAKV